MDDLLLNLSTVPGVGFLNQSKWGVFHHCYTVSLTEVLDSILFQYIDALWSVDAEYFANILS